MSKGIRIAIVVSHPIQHFCPQYVSFASHPDINCKVFFASMLGYKKYTDPDFKQEISWGNLELDKFQHVFLNGEQVLLADKELDAVSLDGELDEFNPQVIITYGYFQKLQRRAHSWARRKKVQIAYISDSERRQQRNPLKQWIKYPYIRWYFSKINFFLTVGNANELFYKSYSVPSEKMIRMHFPIDIKYYRLKFAQRAELRREIRAEFGIKENEFVMSVVGKLVSWKNQDHLLDAMLLLEQQGYYTHLFILGSGPMMDSWQQKATRLKKSRVYFPGFVSIEKLPAFYAASDIYVHPASVEPHSIAVSEAIYMGCPVIISDRCGSYGETDDVQEGKDGFVYPFGGIDALAKKIKRLIDHPEQREEFSARAHELADGFQKRSHEGIIDDLIKKMEY